MITFQINKSADNQFYVTIVGRNGKTIYTSETCKRKHGAQKGIAALTKAIEAGEVRVVDNTIEQS